LHGLAQARAVDTEPVALTLADELEAKHVFFAPHAQVIRASYHGQRGEQDLSTQHRKRGELLALRGGVSWSAVTVMTVRAMYMAQTTSDVIAIVQLLPECERLSEIAPKMKLFREANEAFLELARDRPEQAIAGYERLFASPDAALTPTHHYDQVAYARALCRVGRIEEARKLCLEMVAAMPSNGTLNQRRVGQQQLAECEAALGMFEAAHARLTLLLGQLAPSKNPLWEGLLQRDLARIALATGDDQAFRVHAEAMEAQFLATRNPALIQQIEQLHNEHAARRAVLAPRAAAPQFSDALDELATSIESDPAHLEQLGRGRGQPDNDQGDALDLDAEGARRR
jgi:tetratricopeptide (TPR) repeat protein